MIRKFIMSNIIKITMTLSRPKIFSRVIFIKNRKTKMILKYYFSVREFR